MTNSREMSGKSRSRQTRGMPALRNMKINLNSLERIGIGEGRGKIKMNYDFIIYPILILY